MKNLMQKVEGVVAVTLKLVAQLVLISSCPIPIIILLKDNIDALAHCDS